MEYLKSDKVKYAEYLIDYKDYTDYLTFRLNMFDVFGLENDDQFDKLWVVLLDYNFIYMNKGIQYRLYINKDVIKAFLRKEKIDRIV